MKSIGYQPGGSDQCVRQEMICAAIDVGVMNPSECAKGFVMFTPSGTVMLEVFIVLVKKFLLSLLK